MTRTVAAPALCCSGCVFHSQPADGLAVLQCSLARSQADDLCSKVGDWPATAAEQLASGTTWIVELTGGDLVAAEADAQQSGCLCSTSEAMGAAVRFLGMDQV